MLLLWNQSDDVIGLPLSSVLPASVGLLIIEGLEKACKTGIVTSNQCSYISGADKTAGFVNNTYQPVKDLNGRVYCILHTISSLKATEYDELKNSVAELADSESRFRKLVQQAPVAISILRGPDHIIETANDMILKRWGKGEGILNLPLKTALPELEGQPFLSLISEVYRSGKIQIGHEVKAMLGDTANLTEFYLNFIYKPLKDKNGITTAVMVVATDVTEQVRARKHHQKISDLLQFSVEAANIGTWSKDLQTGEVLISARHKELFGFHADEEVLTNELMLQIPVEYRQQVNMAMETVFTIGGLYDITYPTIGFHDNKFRWTRALGSVIHDEDGNASYFSGVSIETTQQKQDELRKNHFINIVSHELKTPLTSLKGYIQLLQQRSETEGDIYQAATLAKVDTKLDKMTNLINGFLNVSQFESGKIQLKIQEFDLALLLREIAVETNQQWVNRKLISLSCLPVMVEADSDKIGQVISNLLSNAIKYSAPDTLIEISCEENTDTVTVYIKDNGIGITEEDQHLIFERYYRVESPENDLIAGFGIGLYLCNEILQRHKGMLNVKSSPGLGSIFYFSLPIKSLVKT